jgi:hypothetical protein
VWDLDQWLSWKAKNPWLFCKIGELGCSVCRNLQLKVNATQGMHLSEQWRNCSICAETGRKLIEKIYKHKQSEAHKQAEEILAERDKQTLKGVLMDSDNRQFSETVRIFRTAYCIAKENLAFTVHSQLVQLQTLNGLSMGNVHRSHHSCSKIIHHIAQQMKKNFCTKLTASNSKLSIMLDEATLYGTSVVVLYLRACLSGNSEQLPAGCGVENVFF